VLNVGTIALTDTEARLAPAPRPLRIAHKLAIITRPNNKGAAKASFLNMSAHERILSVVQALYDAALDETLWAQALAALTEATGSQAATFWVLDSSDQPRLPTLTCFNFDPAFIADYQNGMVPLDPTVQYLVAHPQTPIVHDGLVISERDKERHVYYDWHGRHSDTRFRLVGQARPAEAVQAGVALHRARKVGRYGPVDLEQFALMHRHLERALTMAYRLGTLGTLQQCTTELLDQHPAAIVLLNHRRRVVYLNRNAADLNVHRDGVAIDSNGLRLLQARDNVRLQVLIGRALTREPSGAAVGGVMHAARPSGSRPYGIFVTPVSHEYPALSSVRPAVCVMVTDPDRRRPSLARRLCVMFGLTEAEARLAEMLVAGEELRAAASTLGITYGTARVRLAEIFQKTNTHRQGELVSLILAVATTD
jgi:DNA-binding CsgD family transcriptional regulator